MIKKTYKANTNVSINVVLASKKNLHISFTPLSNGSSTFTTDNEEVMNAIERHYKFGKLFRLESVEGELGTDEIDGSSGSSGSNEADEIDEIDGSNEADEIDEADGGFTKVVVSDYATAKEYLAEKFNISRTSLRSTKAILQHAAEQGIEFVGLS